VEYFGLGEPSSTPSKRPLRPERRAERSGACPWRLRPVTTLRAPLP